MDRLRNLLIHNYAAGTHYISHSDTTPDVDKIIRLIAFYLPQYHQIPENDAWWGEGFTEWSNASKALPVFDGHYQPHLPGGLGFYDLKNPETLRRQANLARKYGIYGFCFHHYWFSGHTLLDHPINSFLSDKSININFCINWANESWCRSWDGREKDILIEQKYMPDDGRKIAENLLRYVEDSRYIRIGGRPLVLIYRPAAIPDARAMIETIREVFQRHGVGNPFMVMPQVFDDRDPRPYGMDAAVEFPPHKIGGSIPDMNDELEFLDSNFRGRIFRFDDIVRASTTLEAAPYRTFKTVSPCWDNTARKPKTAIVYADSTPQKYGQWLEMVSRQTIETNPDDERLVFINAWNEWAEGAHLEPDRHFGYGYLVETRRVQERLVEKKQATYTNKVSKSYFDKWLLRLARVKRLIFGQRTNI